jgi:membrane carboxypeptidase/penicillin-binding protein PbpC
VRQLSVSCLLEGRASDTELLRLWLRRASFGPGLTGLDAASQAIFNKAPSLLDQIESAKLVALIYQPGLRNQPAEWESRGDIITQTDFAN